MEDKPEPEKTPEPEKIPDEKPSDIQLLLKHMQSMEDRLQQAQQPKPKPKRVVSQKQKDALERARKSRAEITVKRNALKKELKEKNKIAEKKYVNEGLEKIKSDDNTNDAPTEKSTPPVSNEPEPSPVPQNVKFDTVPSLENNPNIPIIQPSRSNEHYIEPNGSLSQFSFASRGRKRR